ncbi:MAG: hypothetical protein ACRC1P_11525 [Cellulosilyticaceae bacterium]
MKKLTAIQDYVEVYFVVDGHKYILKDDDILSIELPNGIMEYLDFKLCRRDLQDGNVIHRWNDARIAFDYEGLELKEFLSELILKHSCKVYVQ